MGRFKDGKPGAYLFYNQDTDKGYVGSTNNLDRRVERHLCDLRNNKHKNSQFQRAFNKGQVFSVVTVTLPDREVALDCEQEFIDTFKNEGKLYNVATDARYCNKGRPMPEEVKKKISEANKGSSNFQGKKHSEETRRKMSEWQVGKKHSPETLAKLKEKAAGRKPTQKAIDAARVAIAERKGVPLTDEQRSVHLKTHAKAVEVDGVVYPTLKEAAAAHGISAGTAVNRLANRAGNFNNWKRVT